MPLSKSAQALMDELAASDAKPIQQQGVEEARARTTALLAYAGDRPPMHDIRDHRLKVAGGEILMRTLTPNVPPQAVIVYYHGGGWVVGDAENYTTLACQIASVTESIVVLPDYRLSPEVRFPVPLNDCYAAAAWASKSFDLPLVVMGDSAGGNLAAGVCLKALDANEPAIAAQILVYPVTDCRNDRASYADSEKHLILTPEGMNWFWDHYLPAEDERRDQLASPLRAPNLRGLPPAVVYLAEYDILIEEGLEFAERLRIAHVPCRVHIGEGLPHAFFVLGGKLPEAGEALRTIARDLNSLLKNSSTTSADTNEDQLCS